MKHGIPAQTLEKIRRDAERIRTLARFVVVLDEKASVERIIENKDGSSRHPIQPILAILAPTTIGSTHIPETVVFEMTYDRAVPYRRIEENIEGNRVRIPLTKRFRTRIITEVELHSAWELLEKGMLSILKERMYYWRSLGEKFWLKKSNGFQSGILFRCPTEDTAVFTTLWREHLQYRSQHLLDALKLIAHYKKWDYTDKQLGRMVGAYKFADILLGRRVVERRYILKRAKSLGPLAERICEWKHIPLTDPDPYSPTALLYDGNIPEKKLLPPFGKISVYFREKPREKHAMGCFSVELIPRDTVVSEWKRLKGKEISQYWKQRQGDTLTVPRDTDDDIPFTLEEIESHAAQHPTQSVTDDSIPF